MIFSQGEPAVLPEEPLCLTICEPLVDQIALLPGVSKDTVLQSVRERRFDHISAIYDLLLDTKAEEARGQGQAGPPQIQDFQFPVPRKASITTGVVERSEAPPEIQLLLNDSQIYEKVGRPKIFMLIATLNTVFKSKS